MNIGFLAHVDAGKTTTVEQLLFRFGNLRNPGSVDAGDTVTDFLSVERERGISVKSASVDIELNNLRICIIDTPGHMDFTGEVERTLSVLDGAVLVVSAAEGIQSQTERFWNALRALKIPTIIFVNKIDRFGCMPEDVADALKKDFSSAIVARNAALHYGDAHAAAEPAAISEDDMFELSEHDKTFADKFLSGTATQDDAYARLKQQAHDAAAFPLVYGASAHGIGIDTLLETIRDFFPSRSIHPQGTASGFIYKIEHIKNEGKLAHVLLQSGTLEIRDQVDILHATGDTTTERVNRIKRTYGARREDIKQLQGNEIAAVYGFTSGKVGDVFGDAAYRNFKISEPLFAVKVTGPEGKERELLQAISELSDEDPAMQHTWNPDLRELSIRIMGRIQLEILEQLIAERYQLNVAFSPPTVIYKETVTHEGTGHERYTMPKPCWAVVTMDVAPLPSGSGIQYHDDVHESVLAKQYRNHIAIATRDTIKQGRMGWEVTDARFTLTFGESHKFHTHPMDFFLATPIAVQRALQNAVPQLLEPLIKIKLIADEGFSNRIIGDVIAMRGNLLDSAIIKNLVHIEAIVPVATSADYYIQFASMTSGRGLLSTDFAGYQACPNELGAINPRIGVDPLDRAKWILYKRGALS